MTPESQARALIGALNLLAEMHDELESKELHGASDEVARLKAALRQQLHALVEEAGLNKVEVLMPPLRTVDELEQVRADARMRDLGYYVPVGETK